MRPTTPTRQGGGIVLGLVRNTELIVKTGKRHGVTAGVHIMSPFRFVPLTQIRRFMHILDNIAPTNARVVSAEGDLPFLRSVRNDAALGAAKNLVPQNLQTHTTPQT